MYPHDMGIGGSQLNAIELAGAVRDLGHEVALFGRPGALNARAAQLGLDFIESPDPTRRPSAAVIRSLRSLARNRGLDVVHGYEWPPTIEARLACWGLSRTVCVSTVMSMSVAPFIPRHVPLVVGTKQIAAAEGARANVTVLEPPVDLEHNRLPPQGEIDAFRLSRGLTDDLLVVCVTRLAAELKLEGLLKAIQVVPTLHPGTQLLLVGDGPARDVVSTAAAAVNDRLGRRAVVLTGVMPDPRLAYGAADVVLGMGGSALRGMAFGKPLVVQGEQGFWCELAPGTLDGFLWTGWYGVGPGEAHGGAALAAALTPLLADASLRAERGRFARHTVEELFSLQSAAAIQVEVYERALGMPPRGIRPLLQDASGMAGLARHIARRRLLRWRGDAVSDDFNARPTVRQRAEP